LHPVRKHQRFFQAWSSKVNLQNRVNSFMKNLLRDGQTVVYKKNGKLNKKLVDQLLKANKELDNKDVQKILDLKIDFRKFVIPVDYIFISPATVEKLNTDLGKLYEGQDVIGLYLNDVVVEKIKNP